MGFLKDHIWPSIALVVSGLWTIYGIVSGVYDLSTLGVPEAVWIAIGAIAFMATVVALLVRFDRRLTISAVSASGNSPSQIVPATLSGGSASTRKLFQNDELSVWDLTPRGEHIIRGKTFVDCVFYGPAVVAFLNDVHVDGLEFDTDDLEKNLIEIQRDRWIVGVYGFQDCRIERCSFKKIGIAGDKERLDMIRKVSCRGSWGSAFSC